MSGPDDELDNLLRSHFAGELDPMRGQARRAFDREVTRPMRRRLRINAWTAAGHRLARGAAVRARSHASTGLAMAAAAAVGFFLPRALTPPAPTAPAETVAEVTPRVPALGDYERTRALGHEDRGVTADADGRAVRQFRRSEMESARYVDPDTHARTEYYSFPAEQDVVYPSARQ